MSIGIPVKLLHEAEGHTVTIELKTGELYRGKLIEAEDNMNCQVRNRFCLFNLGYIVKLDTREYMSSLAVCCVGV